MNRRIIKGRAAGFTLLEIMLAVTILAMLVIVVSATWNAGLLGWKRGSQANDRFQRQRIVTETLTELTRSAMLLSSKDGLYQVAGERGEGADSISFVTTSDLLLPPSESSLAGMRRVAVFMQRDERGRPYLALQNSPALVPESAHVQPVVHVLSADVTGFSVNYRHPRDGSWKDKWDESGLAPSAIEYTVAFSGGGDQSAPAVVTWAVDLPAAQYVMMLRGEQLGRNNSTNTVSRREIATLSDSGGGDEE